MAPTGNVAPTPNEPNIRMGRGGWAADAATTEKKEKHAIG